MIGYLALVILAAIGGGLAGFAIGSSLEALYWWKVRGSIRPIGFVEFIRRELRP